MRPAKWIRSRVVGFGRELLIQLDRRRGKEFQLVFRLARDRSRAPRRGPTDPDVTVLRSLDQMREPQMVAILENSPHLGSPSGVAEAIREGNRIYLIQHRGKAICSLWVSQPQARGKTWYQPLGPRDIVLLRFHTDIDWRGRGMIGRLLETAIPQELESGGDAFTDCSVRNWPSRRAMEKVGFELVARTRTVHEFERAPQERRSLEV
jgi:hypothetical protein